ncbi:MAG: hypothetical protein Q9221_000387 [Calogaya cf. arnoldii]
MPAIDNSRHPGKRALADQDRRASKKVKLGQDSSKDQVHHGDKAVSSLMEDSPTHSSSPVTEHTGTEGASDKGGKRRKRKRHGQRHASNQSA